MKKLLLIFMALAAMVIVVIVSNQHVAGTGKKAGQRKKTPQEREAGADKQAGSWFWSRAYPDPEGMNDKFFNGWLQAQAMKNPELKSQSATSGTRNTVSSMNLFSGNWTAIGPNQNIG